MKDAPRIRILPPELADQIAAGEVVERPASVVKELVENGLDAGARRIDVEVESGGRRLVRVVDDGCGMTPEEARLAVQRHATSKIRRADDLWGLATFGFRGEALPSVCAVSRLVLRTKATGATAGFQIALEGGIEREAAEVGMGDGTQVEVRDLFFNTPARQKFLKNEATEMANISEALLRLALANSGTQFRLRAGGRSVLDLAPQRVPAERVRAALARRGASVLHEAEGEENGVRVRAYLASPEEAASSARSTFLFVGRRFVRDRSLLHALAMGYGEVLEKGRYPLAALFVDAPDRDVDINVHPQKVEVRFARPQDVYTAVRHVVSAAVARAPWLASAPVRAYTMPPAPRPDWNGEGLRSDRSDQEPLALGRPEGARPPLPMRAHDQESPSPDPVPAPPAPDAAAPFFAGLEYIGQLHRTYLVCQGGAELILVDQHAAHERVAFARLRAAHTRRAIAHQRLLFPIPVEVDETAAAAASSPGTRELLESLGFEAEPFGPSTVLLRAVPELLKDVDPKPLLLDLLQRLADGTGPELAQDRLDHVFATMACHSVVRAGDVLGREQAAALLGQLDAVDLRSHCPHGRPVLLRMSLSEIERRFGRA